ncbi:phosphoribosyltransferase [soil metagenome]
MTRGEVALFEDRAAAGLELGQRLQAEGYGADALVLALPRGGVPVAFEVAKALGAPLDVFTVRKLGTPGQEELAMGAIASGGVRVMNDDLVAELGVSKENVERVIKRESAELARRERLYRGARPPLEFEGRTVILIDDGIATGASMRAAVAALKQRHLGKLVVAVPVAAAETCATLARKVDEIICLKTPEPFYGVGRWYKHFSQTSDEEVQALLKEAAAEM